MRRSTLLTKATPGGRSRWRTLLAGMVVAGIAMGGLAAAAPAAAEDTPVPASTLEIAVTACGSYGGQGVLNYVVRDPNPFFRDFIWIRDATNAIVHEATYLDGTEFEADVDLDPGTYSIQYSVEHETGAAIIDVQTFTIGECPDLGVAVTPLSCSTERDGITFVTFTGLVPGELYGFEVVGPNFLVSGPFEAESETQEREFVGMPPGNYYVYVQWIPPDGQEAPAPTFDWIAFSVDPCQPAIEVAVTQCTAVGGTGGVDVTLSRLVAGVEYAVWVTDAGTPDGQPYREPQFVTGDADAAAAVQFASLPAGKAYTVWVEGVWDAGPWEEPPFIGGGNFIPLETVELTTSADFSLQPCPAAPVKPASTATLPPTGPEGIGGLLGGAVLLLGLGAAALLVARRRRAGAPDLS
jgi:hypothetical protein